MNALSYDYTASIEVIYVFPFGYLSNYTFHDNNTKNPKIFKNSSVWHNLIKLSMVEA